MVRKYEKPLHIDMSIEEALERFAGTDPDELPENARLRRAKKAGRKKHPTFKVTDSQHGSE